MSVTLSQPTTAVVGVGAMMAAVAVADPELECVTFEDLYADGVQLCEDMWDQAFEVVDDDEGHTMWFFDDKNPNDAVSQEAGLEGANETCYLNDYYHKEKPGPEPLIGECGAFRGDACCKTETVSTTADLLNIYGPEYRPDRCGPLTRQCESFFVHEACFYECDVNTGYYRKYVEDGAPSDGNAGRVKYNPACNPLDDKFYNDIGEDGKSPIGEEYVANNVAICGSNGHNQWQLYKMPVKRSYCNAWYNACRKDKFCGVADGSFFECARKFPQEPVDTRVEEVETISPGAVAGIAVVSILAVVAVVVIGFFVWRERSGRPVFKALANGDDVYVNMDPNPN